MVTLEKILQTMNSWQWGEVIAVCGKKCSGASSRSTEYVFVKISMSKLKNHRGYQLQSNVELTPATPVFWVGVWGGSSVGFGTPHLDPVSCGAVRRRLGLDLVLRHHSHGAATISHCRYLSSECRIAECGVISLWGLHCTLRCPGCGVQAAAGEAAASTRLGRDSEDTALGHTTASCAAFPSAHQHGWKSFTFLVIRKTGAKASGWEIRHLSCFYH